MRTLLRFAVLMCADRGLGAVADAQWRCLYATWDDDATNINAIGTIRSWCRCHHEDMFVALGSSWSTSTGNTECFMIPYVNADSSNGRTYFYGYGSAASR